MKTIASLIRKNIKRYYSPKMINLVIKMIEFEESERFSFLDIKNYIEENFNFDEFWELFYIIVLVKVIKCVFILIFLFV